MTPFVVWLWCAPPTAALQSLRHDRPRRVVSSSSRPPLVRRGPPPQESAVAGVWEAYLGALQAAPLPVKAATATVIIGAGDAAAQAIESKGTSISPGRVARWAFFGFILQAPWNHYWQNFLEALIPSTPSPWTWTTVGKVALDQFLQAPLFTALIFYFFAIIEGRGFDAGTDQISRELKATLLKNWLIFLPATFINLGLVPLELRVLFINCVFFVWVIILSLLINATKDPEAAHLITHDDDDATGSKS
mmetsp:Transcript_21830/g.70278  ORF Transcript_21830/g.70278 Transcript_21830/m.70278 type:complete len:248 (+) Transcript_21830:71-814(+)|eukprot:CAMPEP_0118901886 /NCGR_PEP_ID=MMETSP1166-20130328/7413_1 /TAXON_ID=1104430 /ORGANISM="Chrysoreinhardia sp, Strain CCMP3193" /LENGTH=247 /DNA_ID=CAMNT_0006841075 /DNA_START=50 /DNA_END=793 /DNA_ORIENTATION=+